MRTIQSIIDLVLPTRLKSVLCIENYWIANNSSVLCPSHFTRAFTGGLQNKITDILSWRNLESEGTAVILSRNIISESSGSGVVLRNISTWFQTGRGRNCFFRLLTSLSLPLCTGLSCDDATAPTNLPLIYYCT